MIGVRGPTGAWAGFAILAVAPAAGPAPLPFNASADAVGAPPTCAGGGRTAAWRAALAATARVAVVACGAGGGRAVYGATVAVTPAATLRVRFAVGGAAAAAFTPAVRAGFVAAAARRLKIDPLQIELDLVRGWGRGLQRGEWVCWGGGTEAGWEVGRRAEGMG